MRREEYTFGEEETITATEVLPAFKKSPQS